MDEQVEKVYHVAPREDIVARKQIERILFPAKHKQKCHAHNDYCHHSESVHGFASVTQTDCKLNCGACMRK